MGTRGWSTEEFKSYSKSKGMKLSRDGVVLGITSSQDNFKSWGLNVALDPKNVVRECRDSDEHPNTIPVILALDVTGSMGDAAVEVAKKLNVIMTRLFENIKDVEFMIMGIGDLAYDSTPIQASQFESDIRIAEQLDKLYFEYGGGGNSFESYSAAWYFGLHHTDLDCWKRGKKGIIVTMGDEMLNPYLPIKGYRSGLKDATGDKLQGDVETNELYKDASQKFDIYHLGVVHDRWSKDRATNAKLSFEKVLQPGHYKEVSLDTIVDTIVDIIVGAGNNTPTVTGSGTTGEISW